MREKNVSIGMVWVCMLLCCSQIQDSHMVTQKQSRDLEGVGLRKKLKDLSAHERLGFAKTKGPEYK